jgi:hypothetical protein
MTTQKAQSSAPPAYNFLAFSKKTNEAGLISLSRAGCVMEIEIGITGLNQE